MSSVIAAQIYLTRGCITRLNCLIGLEVLQYSVLAYAAFNNYTYIN